MVKGSRLAKYPRMLKSPSTPSHDLVVPHCVESGVLRLVVLVFVCSFVSFFLGCSIAVSIVCYVDIVNKYGSCKIASSYFLAVVGLYIVCLAV